MGVIKNRKTNLAKYNIAAHGTIRILPQWRIEWGKERSQKTDGGARTMGTTAVL